jgi:hydroxymethylbilane synthase
MTDPCSLIPDPLPLKIGSRGSQLALWQANHIADQLRARGHEVAIEIIRTSGDAMQHLTFAQVGKAVPKGMFTKEIEEALFDKRIDLAVHSLKDLPTTLDEPFAIAAVPPRADPRDAFVSIDHESFAALPPGSRIGTSSLRRRAQLRSLRSDLNYLEFRGNVDTRLRKLSEGEADAIILASAGLSRLDRTEHIREYFPPLVLCPAAGQGALAIETRVGDTAIIEALAFLDDPASRFAVTAERAALAALGGGCQVPIGIHCEPSPAGVTITSGFTITGAVTSPDGHSVIRAALDHQHGDDPAALGQKLAARLLDQGAKSILEITAP